MSVIFYARIRAREVGHYLLCRVVGGVIVNMDLKIFVTLSEHAQDRPLEQFRSAISGYYRRDLYHSVILVSCL